MGSIGDLEPAIPAHLRVERTIPTKTPPDFQPPFPAYSARFPVETKDLVTAIIGVQHASSVNNKTDGFKQLASWMEKDAECKPNYWEAAAVTDNQGYYNEVVIPYWPSREDFDKWRSKSGFDSWWQSLAPGGDTGWFLEVFLPSIDRLETVFSDNVKPEGAAHMRESVSGTLQEHVYWGSMRDRLPIAQNDHLTGTKAFASDSPIGKPENTKSQRINVPGRENLAMIRSGQDWSNTNPHERKLYLDTMHPVLTKGMHFLRDNGEEVGCIECRFMDVIHKDESVNEPTDKTFGLAYFDDLASLEGWSKDHQTHKDIFGRFIQYAGELQNNVSLRLFHEVMVLKPDQQIFEYVGCHNRTGMLTCFHS
jgi:hypothetical protein